MFQMTQGFSVQEMIQKLCEIATDYMHVKLQIFQHYPAINKWRMDALRATRHIETSQPQDAARLLATSRHWCGRDGVNGGDRSFGYLDQIHLWSNMRMVAAWLQPFNLDLNKCFGKWLLHSCMFIRYHQMYYRRSFLNEPLTQPDLSLSPQVACHLPDAKYLIEDPPKATAGSLVGQDQLSQCG